MATNQEGYRFRNDDGTESSASWKAAQDTDVSITAGENFRLRVIVDTTEAAAGERTYPLLYKKSTDAHYKRVMTAVEAPQDPIVLTNSPFIGSPAAETTTAQLTAPAGSPKSFQNGYLVDESNPGPSITINQDGYTEVEYTLKAVDGIAQNGEIYQFRVAGNTAAAGGGASISDDFETDTSANWTPDTSFTITGGQLVMDAEGLVRHITSLGTGNIWTRVALPATQTNNYLVTFSCDSSGNGLAAAVSRTASGVEVGVITRYTTYTTYASNDTDYGTAGASVATFGVTLDKTNRVVRFFSDPSGVPASITDWNGAAFKSIDYSADYSNQGDFVGLGSWTATPNEHFNAFDAAAF